MKVCPVCEATCFDDMEICIECLHDFASDVIDITDETVSSFDTKVFADDAVTVMPDLSVTVPTVESIQSIDTPVELKKNNNESTTEADVSDLQLDCKDSKNQLNGKWMYAHEEVLDESDTVYVNTVVQKREKEIQSDNHEAQASIVIEIRGLKPETSVCIR